MLALRLTFGGGAMIMVIAKLLRHLRPSNLDSFTQRGSLALRGSLGAPQQLFHTQRWPMNCPSTEATIKLSVHFTRSVCGERIKCLINRVAYERGIIFLQLNSFCLFIYVQLSTSRVAVFKFVNGNSVEIYVSKFNFSLPEQIEQHSISLAFSVHLNY